MNNYTFATGSEDGSISLWSTGVNKPIQTLPNPHSQTWISSLTSFPNSDLLISGAADGQLLFHKLSYRGPKKCSVTESLNVECKGVINCMQVNRNGQMLAVIQSPENRLGRWTVCKKVRSRIKIYKLN